MMMSPSSIASASSLITASVGSPALTMMMTRRGFSRAARNSGMVSLRTKLPSEPCSFSSASVFATDRLCNATVYPWWAKLRARFEPMTASPVTPICAVPVFESLESWALMSSPLRLENFCYTVSVTLWHSGVLVRQRDSPWAALEVEQPLELGEPGHCQRDGGH